MNNPFTRFTTAARIGCRFPFADQSRRGGVTPAPTASMNFPPPARSSRGRYWGGVGHGEF